MTERGVTESVVEDAALGSLETLGYIIVHGPSEIPARGRRNKDLDGIVENN